MILAVETTVWETNVPNHAYLLSDDKSKVYGYAKKGTENIEWFKKPIDFSIRGRKFNVLKTGLNNPLSIEPPSVPQGIKVQGSKGAVYYINNGKCTCPGFKYRGVCKHV
jgi:hypothetical protein